MNVIEEIAKGADKVLGLGEEQVKGMATDLVTILVTNDFTRLANDTLFIEDKEKARELYHKVVELGIELNVAIGAKKNENLDVDVRINGAFEKAWESRQAALDAANGNLMDRMVMPQPANVM